MKSLPYIIGILVVCAVAIFIFISNKNRTELPNNPIPSFSLADGDGNTITNEDFPGKILVINSWATWCTFCKKELPDLALLQAEFLDEIVVIAINRRESLEQIRVYTDTLNVTDGIIFLLDPSDSFYTSIGGFAMPETIFVDQEGIIRTHKRGIMDLEEMRSLVNTILES